ncbi:MAG: DUF433 domain-containing protein [bacterium]
MHDPIVVDLNIQHGKPVIRGTRVPVTRIVGGLAGGMAMDEIITEYEITRDEVLAALKFAAEIIDAYQFHSIPQAG